MYMVGIRDRIALAGTTQERVAQAVGIEPSLFSRILRGLRQPPEGFESRVRAALDRMEAAERAADEARRRFLAGEGAR